MANQNGNGRNVSSPDENRPSWRPEDENEYSSRGRRGTSEDRGERLWRNDRDDEERFMRDRFGSHWEDREDRPYRGESHRSTEYYGQGQSGYGAGRYEDDRSMRFQQRNVGYPRSFDERSRERGVDERFAIGRGGRPWSERDERDDRWGNEGYSGGYDERHGGGYLGQGGQQMGYGRDFQQGRYGQQGYGPGYDEGGGRRGYAQQGMQGMRGMYSGYDEGVSGPTGMQQRYGTQGYQGFGQQPGMHRGKGPSGYIRSDERVREMVCEALTEHDHIDATNIEITVKNGEVTLAGTVEDRRQKRLAEDVVEQLSGVKDVQNQIRVGGDGKKVSGKETETPASSDKRGRA